MGSFLDPQLTKDKNGNDVPYAPKRFKEIIQERYIISKMINTSYNDIGRITPQERKCLIEFIIDEQEKRKQALKEELKNVDQGKLK